MRSSIPALLLLAVATPSCGKTPELPPLKLPDVPGQTGNIPVTGPADPAMGDEPPVDLSPPPAGTLPGQDFDSLVEDLAAARPIPAPKSATTTIETSTSVDGRFSLSTPNGYWYIDPVSSQRYSNGLYLNRSGGDDGMSWLQGRSAELARGGIQVVLKDESGHGQSMIDFEGSGGYAHEAVSLETYRGAALYCGVLKYARTRNVCSLVLVALHGKRTVRVHSLVLGTSPMHRDALVREFAHVIATLELHD